MSGGFERGIRIVVANPDQIPLATQLIEQLRRQFAIAAALKPNELKNGSLFLFTNKSHNRLEALYFDRTGMCVLAKRLEVGTFSWPAATPRGQLQINLTPEALHLLLDGVDLRGPHSRPWYERES